MEVISERVVRLLRWSERYTKTDMVYLASGGFWIIAGQVVSTMLAFALSLAFANLLPKEVYGTYRFVLSIIAIVGVFAFTGIDAAVTQAVARGFEGMLRKGFSTYVKWSAGIVIAAGALAIYYFLNGNATIGWSLLIAGTCSPIISGASLYAEFLSGKRAFRTVALCVAIQSVATTALLFLVMLTSHSVVALISAYFIGNLVSSLLLYFFVLRRFRPNHKVDPKSIRFGKHVSLTNVLGTIADQLDKLLIFHFLGAAQLATYAFATAIPEYLRSSTKIFSTLALPKYAQREVSTLQHSLLRKTLQLGLTLLGVALFYILIAPFFFSVFYPNYLEAIPYSQVYAFIILAGAATLPGAVLNSKLAVREQYILTITDNTAKIILLVVLTIFFGIWGTVCARLLGRLVTFVLSLLLAKRLR